MKAKDIKTLITSGTIILAAALYMIFGNDSADQNQSQNNEPQVTQNDTSQSTTDTQTQQQTNAKNKITPAYAVDVTGKELVDVEFISANDGDTMNVRMDGQKERVRLLMVDTPEMNYNKGEPMPYAEEAKAFTTNLLKNAKSIQILHDVGPATDHYDRLLTYVFIDGVLLQESLLKEGLAAVRFINKPNNSLEDDFREIQKEAEAQKLNIWAHKDYFQRDGFHAEFVK